MYDPLHPNVCKVTTLCGSLEQVLSLAFQDRFELPLLSFQVHSEMDASDIDFSTIMHRLLSSYLNLTFLTGIQLRRCKISSKQRRNEADGCPYKQS